MPDGPVPDPDIPAPVRILPQYDNVLLSHKDRSRFIGGDVAAMNSIWMGQLGFVGSVLIDGMLAGMWRVEAPSEHRRTTGAGHDDHHDASSPAEGVRSRRQQRGRSLPAIRHAPGVDHAVRFDSIA